MGFIIFIITTIFIIYLISNLINNFSSTNKNEFNSNYTAHSRSSYKKNTRVQSNRSATKPTQGIRSKIRQAISNNHDIKIEYRKYDGTYSSRRLSNVSFNNEFKLDGYNNDHIKGFCHLRGEERTFRISRIKSIGLI
ncbi:hypothetical protein SAMN06265371_101282 [Lutibacter agarilyticus]|uniref:WYL domain-containing protein n=1 Tax=Lutibacter agarilyticus TaxID=1109740 RepID=A0A238VE53_9FLAO|nr:WYL domain-containing protein [Lutibacter agarilyticus]SNR32526.1 hypothetical protein SAMN06265371_101282 [Lutibacter agarilyticus]